METSVLIQVPYELESAYSPLEERTDIDYTVMSVDNFNVGDFLIGLYITISSNSIITGVVSGMIWDVIKIVSHDVLDKLRQSSKEKTSEKISEQPNKEDGEQETCIKVSLCVRENSKDEYSPHIASKFEPASIVRLYSENKYSFASCGGCSELLKSVFDDFGYRLNALSAETFFSDGVFLVEGTSEVLFYTALARELKLDLDRHNISILSVEGVGFKPYVAICNALNISWVLRTDNDIFSKTSVTPVKKYYAGISRGIGIVKDIGDNKTGLIEYWNQHSKENEWPKDAEIPEEAKKLNEYIRTNIKDLGIFLSDVDLENDLASSELKDTLMNHYGKRDHDDLVNAMQKKKAENMMEFLTKNHKELSCLEESKIVEPLTSLIRITTERTRPDNGERTN